MKPLLFSLILILTSLLSCSTGDKPIAPVMLWFDATANWERLNTREGIERILDLCQGVGVSDVIVDIKPVSGEVLFPSRIARQMHTWQGISRDTSFDYMGTIIAAARERGLRVHVALNVFSEGSRVSGAGLALNERPEWQTILNRPEGLIPTGQAPDKYSAFVNPVDPQVQAYELDLIEEIVRTFGVDGIILDRVRFDSIESDFSPLTRRLFEEFIGQKINSWPQDIFSYTRTSASGEWELLPGPHFKDWIFWRSMQIKGFFEKARQRVKEAAPQVLFGDYAGSWYPTYYEVGVNWASSDYRPQYEWAHPDYHETAYAHLLDFFCSGCYFEEVTRADLEAIKDSIPARRWEAAMGMGNEYWYCVEGACEMSMKVTMGATPVYGSLYLLQYKDRPEKFRQAMQMCLEKTDGLMLFDLIYLEDYKWWDVLEQTIAEHRRKEGR